MSSSPTAGTARSSRAGSHPALPSVRVLVCAAEGAVITGALRGPGAPPGIEILAVPDPASLPDDLDTGWDAAVVEDDGPGWSAEALLDLIHARDVSIPVVVVCAPSHEAAGIALVERGAADYLASDRMARLPVAVRVAVERDALSRKLRRLEAAAPGAGQVPQAAFQPDVTGRWRGQFLKDRQLGFVRSLGSPDEDAALLGALEQIGLSVNATEVRFWEADARGVVRPRVAWSRAGHDATTQPSTQAAPPALVTKVISSRELSFSGVSPAHPVGESLGVPVLKGDHALGAIEISAPDFAGFNDAHAAHLTTLGNYLGIDCAQRRSAADFARSLEELSRVSGERLRLMRLLVEAHEDERRTIAADIHDDSLQILAAVGLRLQTLRRRVNDEAARSTLDAVEQMVGTAVSRLRGLMFNLRPTGLDHGDLLGTIRDRLTQVQQDEGIAYSLAGSEPGALTTAARVTLYRVAQEAIANVVKHASASHVSVSVEERDQGCQMRIADDGAGLAAAAESLPGHLGLASMRERTEVAGGWLRVESGALRGTVVTAWIPLQVGARSGLGSVA
ncbi:MAG: ATP-binding protein [Candidatus Dormibacteria bacterium]